jgi:aspartate carbamoyltransferase
MKDIISVDQFDKEILNEIFEIARNLETEIKEKGKINLLENKVMAALFFEPSTRTRFSFESAMIRLGGGVITESGTANSSLAKGESLEDTIKTIERYVDIIVMRHPEIGSAKRAADASKVPVINAGDGANEHPTQALLDFYTIKKEKKQLEGLNIAMVGDLRYGRTTHSLIKLLSLFEGINFYLVSPEELKMPEKYTSNVKFTRLDKIEDVIEIADVLYMTRIQKERFEDPSKYEQLKNSFILRSEHLKKAKKDLIIAHPLPRVNEIHVDVDGDSRAKYFDQVENGLYMRMALLAIAAGKIKLTEKVKIGEK